MKTIIFNTESDKDYINYAAEKLKNGAIGIFPTDTVYGIGCNAFDENAIKKLFKLKLRDYSKPINVLISDKKMLDLLVDNVSEKEQKLIDAFWPGALTIIFNKKNTIPDLLTSNLNTIGVRMPNNQTCLNLLNSTGTPIATTSANISNEVPGIKISDFYNTFNNKVDFILDSGISDIKIASTIVQIVDNVPYILREGSITKKQIEEALS